MAIPDYQTVMLPLLGFLKDGKEHNIGEVVDALADEFNLAAKIKGDRFIFLRMTFPTARLKGLGRRINVKGAGGSCRK